MKASGKFVICDRGNERSRMQIFTKHGHFVRYIDRLRVVLPKKIVTLTVSQIFNVKRRLGILPKAQGRVAGRWLHRQRVL